MKKKIGEWSFFVGIVLVVILGLSAVPENYEQTLSYTLIILGLLVGALNITTKEKAPFLIASITLLMIATSLGTLPHLGGKISSLADRLKEFVSASAFIVALKTVWDLSKNK